MKEKLQEIGRFFASCKITRVKASGAMALSLKDVNDNEVVFEVNDESEIVVGTKASPNGTFTFANGKTITVEGGEVKTIEVAENPKPEEQPAEGKEHADEQEEIDKNARIAELEDENAQLKEALSDKEQKLADKDALVKELEARIKELEGDNEANAKRLEHLEALAKSIQIDEHREKEEEQPTGKFSFKKK